MTTRPAARLIGEGRAGWGAMLAALVSGGVAALGQAPFDLWFLTPAGLACLIALVLPAQGLWRVARLMWLGGAGYFAVALVWIVQPFLVDAGRHGWMAPFALILLAGGLALFWGAAGYGAARLGGSRGGRAVALVLLLALGGLLRSYLFTGFPWALPGHAWIATPALQLAAFIGPHGLNLLVWALAALLALGLRQAVGAAVLLALLWGTGAWMQAQPVPARDQPMTVRLIQPNAAQHLKWQRDMVPVFFDRQIALTRAPGDPAPDLIVWPETAIAWSLNSAGPALRQIALASGGAPVILGANRREGDRVFNAAVALDAQGEVTQIYDKYHLVPFGEYMPFGDRLARLGLFGLASGGIGFSPGPGPQVWDLGGAGKVLPLICYEMIFPNDLRAAPRRPDWVLQLTNDAWFGSFSGPYQHLAQARLRAVEQGLPVLRSANTGVSAAITARGQVVASLPLNRQGALDVALPGALPPTFYARTGDLPAAILLLAGLVLVALRGHRRGAISR
ncbi:apolipoprotein N-acyltransferase [Actibacterium sp. XHP0104]|uniref:apolipoprotein N-acyltransferase n=1 Tax=Actibacterium sp. XHP0104 TaxID=2984335 RepID=UPI0021E750B4|nr:apolipoprotein N-acyltransferase [Actibacterium sp. XHP0104]MCV2882189.1 apolipoprotein N-acyltransferase [Actibacterium sp. XHP0104]